MAGYQSGYSPHSASPNTYSSGKAGSLAVPPARPAAAGSRKGSHASRASVDLSDADGYYGQAGSLEQDPDVPLEVDTFQAPDFNVGRLVGGLTDRLIAESKQGGGGELCYRCEEELHI